MAKSITQWALTILVLAAIFFGGYYVGGRSKKEKETVRDTIIVPGDKEFKEIIVEKPVPKIVYKTKTDTVFKRDTIKTPLPTDTLAIVKDYNRVRNYNDTTTDGEVSIWWDIYVHRNRITTIDFHRKILRPQTINRTIINNYNKGIFAGVRTTYYKNSDLQFNIEAELSYLNKQHEYGISVGLLEKTYSIYYKQKLW